MFVRLRVQGFESSVNKVFQKETLVNSKTIKIYSPLKEVQQELTWFNSNRSNHNRKTTLTNTATTTAATTPTTAATTERATSTMTAAIITLLSIKKQEKLQKHHQL